MYMMVSCLSGNKVDGTPGVNLGGGFESLWVHLGVCPSISEVSMRASKSKQLGSTPRIGKDGKFVGAAHYVNAHFERLR